MNIFTWYSNRKQRFTQSEMEHKYNVLKEMSGWSDHDLESFLKQIHESGYIAGKESCDTSWSNVK